MSADRHRRAAEPAGTLLEQILPGVRKPGQYIGGEVNAVRKDPGRVALRIALGYPDTYALGMGHQGLRILYDILNQREDVYCERFFAPWLDMERRMRACGLELFSLETRTPLRAFDVVGFTLPYELSCTNLLNCLDLGGITVEAAERGPAEPLVVAGGSGALNPEVLADFIDLFFLGDGEEAVVRFCDELPSARAAARGRRELLEELCRRLPFLYAPALWSMEWNPDGTLAGAIAAPGVNPPARALVRDFERAPIPLAPVVPGVDVVHDRIAIEIMRGCVQGCRFCQAGYQKRPQRYRSAEKVLELARAIYAATGYDEIALTSLSSSDHPDLARIMALLDEEFADRRVGISLPSLRVDQQLRDLPARIRSVRKSGLTLAPEVATDRLRRLINKDIRNEDLYAGAEAAWREGWRRMKLYLMIGVPEEREEDIAAIIELAERVSRLRRVGGRSRPGMVHASIATLVPKPLTPFQWYGQATREEIAFRQDLLRSLRRMRSVVLKFPSRERSWLEGVLARADRRVGPAILRAWQLGARMDAWEDCFDPAIWERAFSECELDPWWYAHRERSAQEIFPWDHLDAGVSKSFLRREYERSLELEVSEHCQRGRCGNCGVDARACIEIKGSSPYFPECAAIVARRDHRDSQED